MHATGCVRRRRRTGLSTWGLSSGCADGGVPTVQYVSPSVWAWRRGRMNKIGRATDCVLCLLPFETAYYEAQQHPAVFTGHPLADEIPLVNPPAPAREYAGVCGGAVLTWPCFRAADRARLRASDRSSRRRLLCWRASTPHSGLWRPMASEATRALFAQQLREHAPGVLVQLLDGNAQAAMTAADAVLLASGTAVLEALLVGRPHVVAYRIAPVTAGLVRGLGLMHTPYYALSNLLAGRRAGA